MKEEIWKDVPDYVGYLQASNLGRVRSVDRVIIDSSGKRILRRGKILKQRKVPNLKKPRYDVLISVNNKPKRILIHRLVLSAFDDNPNRKNLQVNHKDGNPSNNNVNNLEWCTAKENVHHAVATGLCTTFGETHTSSKLTEKNVKDIRLRYIYTQDTQETIARDYNITRENVKHLCNFKTWKHRIDLDGLTVEEYEVLKKNKQLRNNKNKRI